MSPTVPKLCCIHCGAAAEELYHMFCGNLRLRECENCGNFVDELLEVEPMIIGVKLFLQRKEVYRHFCRNALGHLPLQVPIVLLALDIFLAWSVNNVNNGFDTDEFDFAVEEIRWNVFRVMTQTLLGWTAYVFSVYSARRLLSQDCFTLSRVFYIIIVASFCKLFNVGVLLWSRPEWLEYAAYVVEGCWLLAQYRMLQCSLEKRLLSSALIVACAAYLKFAVSRSESVPDAIESFIIDYF